jgi:hypothetical protein
MRKIFLFAILCISLLSSVIAQIPVSGTVVSAADGLGMPGVTVSEKGTTNGTITGNDGKYSIKVSSGKSTLVFSFIGMKTVEEAVNNRSAVNGGWDKTIRYSTEHNIWKLFSIVIFKIICCLLLLQTHLFGFPTPYWSFRLLFIHIRGL